MIVFFVMAENVNTKRQINYRSVWASSSSSNSSSQSSHSQPSQPPSLSSLSQPHPPNSHSSNHPSRSPPKPQGWSYKAPPSISAVSGPAPTSMFDICVLGLACPGIGCILVGIISAAGTCLFSGRKCLRRRLVILRIRSVRGSPEAAWLCNIIIRIFLGFKRLRKSFEIPQS